MRASFSLAFRLQLLVLCIPSYAADLPDQSNAGHGIFYVNYQYIHVDGFKIDSGTLPIGAIDTYTLNFAMEYQLSNRWSIDIGLPLIRKRYRGDAPHDPRLLDPPHDSEFIDNGTFHTNFQDWQLALRYKAKEGAFGIEPFVALGVPSNDYPFYANSAVGQNLNRFDIGTSFTYQPGLSDAFYQLDVSYEFVEKTLGVNVSHWRVTGQAGYYFTPRISGRAFFLLKQGNGLAFPDDYPPPRTGELWYQHDRLMRHNYINVGLGINWSVNESYRLSFSGLTMVHADQVHIVKYALTVGVSRSF